MNDYTPTTEEVRDGYELNASDLCRQPLGHRDHYAEFDRWLAEHDRQVKAEAWAEGVKSERDYQWRCEDADAAGQGVMIFRPKNPYLNGDSK